jgi:hypothetical protein
VSCKDLRTDALIDRIIDQVGGGQRNIGAAARPQNLSCTVQEMPRQGPPDEGTRAHGWARDSDELSAARFDRMSLTHFRYVPFQRNLENNPLLGHASHAEEQASFGASGYPDKIEQWRREPKLASDGLTSSG